jgi:nitrate/nitrite transporter NarK
LKIMKKNPEIEKSVPAVLMLVLLISIGFLTSLQIFCTPVMLPLIGKDLNLKIDQLSFIWGMSTFGGLFLSLPGGLLGDRLGTRWCIFIICTVAGITLGLRGLAKDIVSMSVLMFIGGGIIGSITPLSTKAIFTWFSQSRVGLANGLFSSFSRLGMAFGAAISVTVAAAILHGWQNTFFLYGAILVFFALLWLIIVREPPKAKSSIGVPFREAFINSIKNRDFWFCVAATFGIMGMNVGFIGYLPTYLQNHGWPEVSSSLALTLYFLSGVIAGPAVLSFSDRTRLRKIFFVIPALMWMGVVGSLAVIKGNIQIWAVVIISGFIYGSLPTMLALIVAETKGIGTRYAATANSISFGLGGAAGLCFAGIGGKLALTNSVLPFIFYPFFCLICIIPFFFTRETGTRNTNVSHKSNELVQPLE